MPWMLVLIVDLGNVAWGAAAAAAPHHLLGPGGQAILPAGYEGYSGGSWSQLAAASPPVAGFITLLFRMYGLYCVLFGIMGSAVAATAFAAVSAGDGGRCSPATPSPWCPR